MARETCFQTILCHARASDLAVLLRGTVLSQLNICNLTVVCNFTGNQNAYKITGRMCGELTDHWRCRRKYAVCRQIKLHAEVTDRIISARDKQVNLSSKNIQKKLVFLLPSNSGGRHESGRNKMTARRNKKRREGRV